MLPQFASYLVNDKVNEGFPDAILAYARFFNKSLAYIFIVAITAAILIWSILIVREKKFSKWLGYYGILVVFFGLIPLLSKVNIMNVSLFSGFVFGIASWLIWTGICLVYTHKPENEITCKIKIDYNVDTCSSQTTNER
ncbi:hypothetical protein D9M68_734930 [compost metagenome]